MLKVGVGKCGRSGGVGGELEERILLRLIVCTGRGGEHAINKIGGILNYYKE